jgi:sortase (surface protein transpeptidase)
MTEPSGGLSIDSQFLGYQRRPVTNRFDSYRRPTARSTPPHRPSGLIEDVISIQNNPKPEEAVVKVPAAQPPTPMQSKVVAPTRQINFASDMTVGNSKSAVLARQSLTKPSDTIVKKTKRSKSQLLLIALASALFLSGILVSLIGFKADKAAQVQATKLTAVANSATKNNRQTDVPSTIPPSSQAVTNYLVAPSHPRYLLIPKLKSKSRVLSVGLTSTGDLGTPSNIYDSAWYNKSALPGQTGAVLIDGHVSSWNSHGVFYGLKSLVPGDTMSLQTGSGTVLNYKVVKTVIYKSNAVDMNAAISPVDPNKPGLNLITCTGDVIPGTSRFNDRLIVFTSQV